MSCSRPQRGDASEARVKHSTTEPHYLYLGIWFVWFLCVRHPVGILYVSIDVDLSCERSTTGYVTVKTEFLGRMPHVNVCPSLIRYIFVLSIKHPLVIQQLSVS